MEQQQFVGLDVSQAETAVCVVDASGAVLWQGKCASTLEAIAATLKRRAPHAARIALETGPMSSWHWRGLSALGLPVVCIDARHARAALAMQVNKTDANDALGLAQIVRTGWYREVQIKSERSHRTRSLLVARAELVGMRKEVSNQLRGLLKVFGHVIGAAGGQTFDARARELAAGDATLSTTADALLSARTALAEQVAPGQAAARPDTRRPSLSAADDRTGRGRDHRSRIRGHHRRPRPVPAFGQCGRLSRADAEALPIRHHGRLGAHLEDRRRAAAQLPVRGRDCSAHPCAALVGAESLERAARQKGRTKDGQGGAVNRAGFPGGSNS